MDQHSTHNKPTLRGALSHFVHLAPSAVYSPISLLPPHPRGDPSARGRAYPSLNPVAEGWLALDGCLPTLECQTLSHQPLLHSPHAASPPRLPHSAEPLKPAPR